MPTHRTLARAFALAALLVALLAACNRTTPPIAPADAARSLPPPARPTDVIALAHFGQPQATVSSVGTLLGTPVPFQIALAVLGFDSTLLSASDLTQPIDVVMTGSGEQPDVLVVFTPAALSSFRATLSGRYRFVPMSGVGDRLDPRTGTASGLRCAVVGVPGDVPSRIVCATRLEALDHAARFAAYESQRRAGEHADAIVDVDGAGARAAFLSSVQRSLQDTTQDLAQTAADERRRHTAPPAFGDPEAVIAIANGFVRAFPAIASDLGSVRARATFDRDAIDLDVHLAIDAAGRSGLSTDALARAGVTTTPPLASSLAADSFAVVTSRTDATARVHALDDGIDALLQILGARVTDASGAHNDLAALVAQSGESLAIGAVREPEGGVEVTALLDQRDHGAAARAALSVIARSRWLRALRFGDLAPEVAFANGVLTLRAPAARSRPAVADAGAPARLPELAVAVAGDALALVVGTHTPSSIAALAARAGGPMPSVFAHAPAGSAQIAVDLAAAAGLGGAHSILTGAYGVARDGAALDGHLQLAVPLDALRVVRSAGAPPRR
jgi:hypothetical protein